MSRNLTHIIYFCTLNVTSREGRVSRNCFNGADIVSGFVTSREGRVSRNRGF